VQANAFSGGLGIHIRVLVYVFFRHPDSTIPQRDIEGKLYLQQYIIPERAYFVNFTPLRLNIAKVIEHILPAQPACCAAA